MENNRNGSGVFYGVIGVATLIVTIIGATFAFFNASTNSTNDAVQTASSNVQNLTLLVDGTSGKKENLIPALETAPQFGTLAGPGANYCKDAAKNNYCSVYTFTVENPNAQSQPIYLHFDITDNSFGNLWFAVFKGSPADGAYALYTHEGQTATPVAVTADGGDPTVAAKAADGKLVIGPTPFIKPTDTTPAGVTYTTTGSGSTLKTTSIALNALTQLLAPTDGTANQGSDFVKYSILVWIHDNNENQNDTDANKSLKLGVRVATGADANSGITAVLGQN